MLGVPLLFWAYFIAEAESSSYISGMSPWLLLLIAFFGYSSWWAGRRLAGDGPPFQLFMIAATALFLICFWFHNGAYSDDVGDWEGEWFFDEARRARARATGENAVRYPLYVAASYIGLWGGMRLRGGSRRRAGGTNG